MDHPAILPDPAFASLADTRGPLRRMSLLSIVGMVFYYLVGALLGVVNGWLTPAA